MKKTVKALWTVYAAALCFGFFQTTAAVSALLGLSEGQYVFLNGGMLAGFVLLIILPVKLFGAQRKTGRRPGKKKSRMHGRRRGGVRPAAACTAAFCLTAVLLAARIIHIPAGGLHMGPHSETIFWGNLFCQVFGSVLAFGALFFLSGFWSAVFMMTGVILLSPLSTGIYVADPQNILLLLAGAELVCIACICRFLKKCVSRRAPASGADADRQHLPFERARSKKPCGRDVFGLVSCSFLCGIFCLADIRLCAFLLLPLGDAVSDERVGARARGRERRQATSAFRTGTYKGLAIFLCTAAAGLLFGAAAWCIGFGKRYGIQTDILDLLRAWFFMEKIRSFPVMLHSPLLSEYTLALSAYLAALLPLFFERAQKTRETVRWILPFLFLFITEQAASVGLQGQALRFLALSATAGAAVTGIFVCREPAAIGVIMKGKKTALEKSTVSPAPGEYLDNPLPVPKRHVRKEMNYGFEPAPEQMYYEIPVADNDDFDV